MNDLPILNCDDCGACCMQQNTPPGYSAVIVNPSLWPEHTGDHERVKHLPSEAAQLILERITEEDEAEDLPCCWLDLETKRCKFYQHRPSICRDHEVGGESCRSWRDEYNIDVDRIMANDQ